MRAQPKHDTIRSRAHRPAPHSVAWAAGGFVLGALCMLAFLVFAVPGTDATPPAPAAAGTSSASTAAISMSEQFLTKLIDQAIASANLPISGVSAQIQPNDRILMTGKLSALGGLVTRPFSATAAVSPLAGRVNVRIVSASVGGAPMPEPLTSALAGAINQQLASATANATAGSSPYYVTGISTAHKQLAIHIRQP